MNDNIFEGANFGDKFLCKNGKIARYICSEQNDLIQNPLYEKIHSIWIENMGIIYKYNSIGESELGTEYSIVSRYQEPIDEERT